MSILLQDGPFDGKRERVTEVSHFHSLRLNGKRIRYKHSGKLDAATGCPIFVYAPRRGWA
jgi:hypothetical protein